MALLNDVRLAANKPPLGWLNPLLYAHPEAFTDITQYGVGLFGASMDSIFTGFVGELRIASDDTEACTSITLPPAAAGAVSPALPTVALVSRGTCSFVTKAENAQAAGAAILIIYNNEDGEVPDINAPIDYDDQITIPTFFIQQALGQELVTSSFAGLQPLFTLASSDDAGPETSVFGNGGDEPDEINSVEVVEVEVAAGQIA